MFDDIDASPVETKPKRKKSPVQHRNLPGEAAMHAGEAVAEDVDETVAEGARWLREEEERERRRAQEATPVTQRRRAAARPIVVSSSPGTEVSSLVVDDSSPLTAQTNAPDDSPTPATAQSKRDRKRKRAADKASMTAPVLQPKKRTKVAPKAPSADAGSSSPMLDLASQLPMQIGTRPVSRTGAAGKALHRLRKSVADDDAATEPAVQPAKQAKATPDPAHGNHGKTATTGRKSKDSTEGDTTRLKSKVAKKLSQRVCSVL